MTVYWKISQGSLNFINNNNNKKVASQWTFIVLEKSAVRICSCPFHTQTDALEIKLTLEAVRVGHC